MSLFKSVKRRVLVLSLAVFSAAAMSAGLAAQDMKVMRIGAGPTGATDFPFGGLVANAISNPPGSRECDRGGSCGVPGLIAVAQTTIDPAENLRAVSRGDLELALSQADTLSWAYRGTSAYQGQEPMRNLRMIARLYPSNVHLVVKKGSPIKAVTDLKGKKVAIGGEASATAGTAKLILSAYGVKWDSVQMRTYDFAAITGALEKGEVDAFFMVSGAPVLALEDLASRTPISFVPIDGPIAEKLPKIFPYYSQGVIPAKTYGDHPAIPTLDVGSVLVGRDTMSAELAYGIVRAIWHERNVPLFQKGHPRGRFMDRAQAARDFGVPIQRGADKYYVQNGLMDPAAAQAVPSAATPDKPEAPARKALLQSLLANKHS
ncbi:MAG: TAXI family TRAP transporter solute-binding subunit [Rhodospirillaceae bacterium]|nr:TAXI family TRAP transporter solute-binding subunit [Rhodospirillaceae bacterium]